MLPAESTPADCSVCAAPPPADSAIARLLRRWGFKDEPDFVLRVVQPALVGMIDGTVSSLAPIFAAAIYSSSAVALRVGFAVALDGGRGLIVPVLKHAEGLNLLGMARGIADLAERARTKKLLPDDVQGGTFTITNPGGYGTFVGTPDQLADHMQLWFESGGCDGFNIMPAYFPDELDVFVDQAVPVLQRRGLFRTEYEGTMLRDHLGLAYPKRKRQS